jgi:hypothetical protein
MLLGVHASCSVHFWLVALYSISRVTTITRAAAQTGVVASPVLLPSTQLHVCQRVPSGNVFSFVPSRPNFDLAPPTYRWPTPGPVRTTVICLASSRYGRQMGDNERQGKWVQPLAIPALEECNVVVGELREAIS